MRPANRRRASAMLVDAYQFQVFLHVAASWRSGILGEFAAPLRAIGLRKLERLDAPLRVTR
jgi:hypothetical protein